MVAGDQVGITGINKGDTKVAGMFGYSDDELSETGSSDIPSINKDMIQNR